MDGFWEGSCEGEAEGDKVTGFVVVGLNVTGLDVVGAKVVGEELTIGVLVGAQVGIRAVGLLVGA